MVAITIHPFQDRNGKSVVIDGTDLSSNQNTEYLRRPIQALLTNDGYCVPDPNTPNRFTVWFIGGSLTVQDPETNLHEWQRFFDPTTLPKRNIREYARVLAAKCFLGAQIMDDSMLHKNGTLSYTLKRPIGGHGKVFIDTLYSDESMRIVRGHKGSIFVFHRVPDHEI